MMTVLKNKDNSGRVIQTKPVDSYACHYNALAGSGLQDL